MTLGYKSTLKSIRTGKAKLVLIAANTPPLRKSELEYYAVSSSGLMRFGPEQVLTSSCRCCPRLRFTTSPETTYVAPPPALVWLEDLASSACPAKKSNLSTLEGSVPPAYTSPPQIELGTAVGKLFRCATMAVLDAGDSDILSDVQA